MRIRALVAQLAGGAAIVAVFFFGTLAILDVLYPRQAGRSFDVKSLPRQTGVLSPDGAINAAEPANPAGYLSYEPYLNLEPGNYAAVVSVVCDSSTNYLDVVSDAGKIYIGKRPFACVSAKEEVRIPFQLKQKASGLEARVFYGGKGTIQLIGMKIEEVR